MAGKKGVGFMWGNIATAIIVLIGIVILILIFYRYISGTSEKIGDINEQIPILNLKGIGWDDMTPVEQEKLENNSEGRKFHLDDIKNNAEKFKNKQDYKSAISKYKEYLELCESQKYAEDCTSSGKSQVDAKIKEIETLLVDKLISDGNNALKTDCEIAKTKFNEAKELGADVDSLLKKAEECLKKGGTDVQKEIKKAEDLVGEGEYDGTIELYRKLLGKDEVKSDVVTKSKLEFQIAEIYYIMGDESSKKTSFNKYEDILANYGEDLSVINIKDPDIIGKSKEKLKEAYSNKEKYYDQITFDKLFIDFNFAGYVNKGWWERTLGILTGPVNDYYIWRPTSNNLVKDFPVTKQISSKEFYITNMNTFKTAGTTWALGEQDTDENPTSMNDLECYAYWKSWYYWFTVKDAVGNVVCDIQKTPAKGVGKGGIVNIGHCDDYFELTMVNAGTVKDGKTLNFKYTCNSEKGLFKDPPVDGQGDSEFFELGFKLKS